MSAANPGASGRIAPGIRLLLLVALALLQLSGLLIPRGKRRAELGEILLAALRLVEIPLVRSLGLADRGFVREHQCVVLGLAPHVAENRADRREDRRHDRD